MAGLLGVLLALEVAGPAVAEEPKNPSEETALAERLADRFPPAWEAAALTLGDDALYLLTSPLRIGPTEALIVVGIGAGIGTLSLADRGIRDVVRHRRKDSLDDAADGISWLGFAPVLFGLNATGVAVGEGIRQYNGDRRFLDTALVATEAQLLTLGFSEGVGYLTARSRPGRSDDPYRFRWGDSSFPSSHASQAFAVAAVVADRYDQPVGAIAYGLAGLVGLSRLVQDRHWAVLRQRGVKSILLHALLR